MMDTIVVEASEDALDEINDFWKEKVESFVTDPNVLFQIELAVEEIFINIANYAYARSDENTDPGTVEAGCFVDESVPEMTLRFIDKGEPFDPLAAKEADLSGKMFMEKEGGFGIHMVKEVMDEVSYVRENDENILIIRKKL